MRLSEWAAAPLATPPPIPLSTDAMGASNHAYRVGAIPTAALADDLHAAGLTYAPELAPIDRYHRHGERLDAYLVGDVIADAFSEAARALDWFLATDEIMRAITADRDLLASIPYQARYGERSAECAHAFRRIEDAERGLPISFDQLELAARSLSATARLIRNFPTSRTEATRRFRSVITLSDVPTVPSVSVREFLATVPAGPIARPDLHAAALAAGVAIGSRTLYAAAEALGWPSANRRGVRRYRVPETP